MASRGEKENGSLRHLLSSDHSHHKPPNHQPVVVRVKPDLIPFKVNRTMVNNINICIMTFPQGLTVLMASNDPNKPDNEGLAWVGSYEIYESETRGYIPVIVITFALTQKSLMTKIKKMESLHHASEIIGRGDIVGFINQFRIKEIELLKKENRIEKHYLDCLIGKYTCLTNMLKPGNQRKP